MKKIIMTVLALVPLALWAQDNTWELPEEEQVEERTSLLKTTVDPKYLRGAVPEVDGKVVFSKTIEAPDKSASQIYDIILQYMQKMVKERNQLNSHVVTDGNQPHVVGVSMEEWLVFKSAALSLDRTRFMYTLKAECIDGRVELTLTNIRYLYEENRRPDRLKAEEWITDKMAVNKKNTRLFPGSAKFRRKTIDRKDFLFNKIESLLQ